MTKAAREPSSAHDVPVEVKWDNYETKTPFFILTAVNTSNLTCMILGFNGSDYEEYRLLGWDPVCLL
jgi:hypothetical protein